MAALAANKNSLKNIDLLTLLWAWNLKDLQHSQGKAGWPNNCSPNTPECTKKKAQANDPTCWLLNSCLEYM
jgi:hypothetical protein